tara:strand:- start:240 stop:371 length:132 start_codon:yes stop_codon:yes gene_type:complete
MSNLTKDDVRKAPQMYLGFPVIPLAASDEKEVEHMMVSLGLIK